MYYQQNYHSHLLNGVTSLVDNHIHHYNGNSEIAPITIGHTHYYRLQSTNDFGHTHILQGNTGPAVFLPDGSHYHFYEGITTMDGLRPHVHEYNGQTK